MRKAVLIATLAAALSACGDQTSSRPSSSTPAPSPAASASPAATPDELAGYSAGVREYYGGEPLDTGGDPNADIEAEYHQPPKPAEAGLGETITLTGTNIGVRMRVTPTRVHPVTVKGKRYTAVDVRMKSTGITIYEGELSEAAVTYPGGKTKPVARGVRAACSNGFDADLRIEVLTSTHGCLVFPADGDARPERLQLALETVPTDAGGIWHLTS